MSGSHTPLVLNLLRSFNPKYMLFWSVRNSEGIVNRVVSICSDITAALLDLKSYAVSSKVVLQCRDLLQELALSNRVRLVWVPGHCGIYGNEEADALARAGTSSAFVGPEPCLPLASSSVTQREREWLVKPHCTS
jgi:hypothetical protein